MHNERHYGPDRQRTTRERNETMRLSKRAAAAVLGSMAFAASLVVTAPPAAAGYWERADHKGAPGGHKYYCAKAEGGDAIACLMPYDERFYVGDGRRDGYDPLMQWKSSSGRSGIVYHELGFTKWAWRNKSFAETTKITFRACYRDPGIASMLQGCGAWRTVSAGSN
jgi:hypothetical protein